MTLEELFPEQGSEWSKEPPASPDLIEKLAKEATEEANIELPEEYLAFLSVSNGGEGSLGMDPGWFALWYAEEVMDLNRGYNVFESIPGFFGFGSNGGGELLAFDTRTPQPWKVYMIPFIPLEEAEAICIAENFTSFANAMGHFTDDEEGIGLE